MKPLNVLLITYSFPPAGGVGVLRAASFARYFPKEGIRLDVLTARNASAVGVDETLLQTIPSEVKVHRTVTLDLPFAMKKAIKKLIAGARPTTANLPLNRAAKEPGLLKQLLDNFLLPDPQVLWLSIAARAARRIIKEREIDLVLITVPPFSSAMLVEKLRKKYHELPMVIDFRDEWLSTTIGLVSFSRNERARDVARKAEQSAVKNATAVVAVTEAARREIRSRYPEEPDSKFHLVANGFDAASLDNSIGTAKDRDDHKIVVTYIGSIYGSTEPGWLVEALQSLPSEVKARFLFRFIGHIEEARFRESLLELGDMVELKGFMRQQEALAVLRESDYALLVTHDPLNVAAKFYDYVGAGKPILATIHPKGEVRRLLEEFHAGWWVDSHDVQAMRQLFIDAANRGASLAGEFHPDREKVAQYERKPLAQRYAALLHAIAEDAR
jgi:hypothetical protein